MQNILEYDLLISLLIAATNLKMLN